MTSPLTVTHEDVDRMMSRLFLVWGEDRRRKLSAFWVLLVIAAIIAGAGVLADSTATVIGAMIVAPLMTPIMGTALALVLADRRQLLFSILHTVAGAVVVVLLGYAMGLLHVGDVVAATNPQVAGRVHPHLIDLVAALATGAVGAFALVRSDVSDILPGVAIAISLVPPLVVVGLTLESGATGESLGALLLFMTNVTAIIAAGVIALLGARVRRAAGATRRVSVTSLIAVAFGLLLVFVPLAVATILSTVEQIVERQAQPVVADWAHDQGVELLDVSSSRGDVRVEVIAADGEPNVDDLRSRLDDASLASVDLQVTVLNGSTITLEGR
jgi:uncharacterized hydrophobic protein (TIGR00271 family)